MYDLLTVWDVDNSWPEMEQLGLRILLAFAAQPDIVVRHVLFTSCVLNYCDVI